MIENWEKPRHQCLSYFLEKNISANLISKKVFDENIGNFVDGPYKDSFGTDYGEPYYPWVQAFGVLKDGTGVFCELFEG